MGNIPDPNKLSTVDFVKKKTVWTRPGTISRPPAGSAQLEGQNVLKDARGK